jgi:hypothetical protein
MLRVGSAPLPGFAFEEFVDLAARSGTTDRAALYMVYDRISAGRAGRVPAQTAVALARLPVAEMKRVAALPSDHATAAAERARFDTIPAPLRCRTARLRDLAISACRPRSAVSDRADRCGD